MSQNLDQQKHGESEVPIEDLFLRRWSPRAFSETLINSDTLKAIFSAGQWAASSFNEQPWRFVVGRKGDPVWQRIFESLAPPNQSWTKSAPVADAYRQRIASLLEKVVVGRADDLASEMGPLVDKPNVVRIDRFVEDAKRYARIIVRGGPIVDGPLAVGAFYRPSMLETEALDGHSPCGDPSLISAIVSVHLPLYPNLRLRLESMFALDLAHSVLAAELDLAIVAEPTENPHLTRMRLETAPLCVVMPADHPAARRGCASIEEFGNVGWMIFPRTVHPVIYDRILDTGRQVAASPLELHHYVAPQEAVQLIAENFGIAFMAKGFAEQIRHPEIAVRPLSEAALHITSYLVLRADQSSRLVNQFGRALLRKLSPNSKIEDASGQLSLGL